MAKPGRATQEKRNRERAQKERFEDKVAQRVIRKEAKAERASKVKDGYDPDLAGIYPGPQPIKED